MHSLVLGVDEVGRGALAGPVCVAAVLWEREPEKDMPILKDSKLLSPKKREKFSQIILQRATCVEISWRTHEEIDRSNILAATLDAMSESVLRALDILKTKHNHFDIVIDGNQMPKKLQNLQSYKFEGDIIALPKADQNIQAVCAASIVAKVARDSFMEQLEMQYPCYGFSKNKGYGTVKHLESLKTFGVSKVHRRSFAPMNRMC